MNRKTFKKSFSLVILIIILLHLFHCRKKERLLIMSVTGPLQAAQMGEALTHEHILVDFIGADSTGYERWDREVVAEKMLPYLRDLKEIGVKTFVDCTPAFLGRDPVLLQMLSERSGLVILTNTGFYGAMNNKFIPKFAFTESADQLAARWIQEWQQGIGDTGIRPGFIKIAVANADTSSALHEKLVRAAARTHLQTGLTIASHTGPDKPAFAQIVVLKEEGVDPDAFIWVHANRGTRDGQIKAAKMGAWISFDKVDTTRDMLNACTEFLTDMKLANLLRKVLISQDAGFYTASKPDGGDITPYTTIHKLLLPILKEHGFTDDDIHQLLVTNPQKAFGIKVRRVSQ
ncbi:phosphotriesterase [candidate division KSB1 bacterium]|nr:phosphotriesterase [candidate division KSB1 bacterium]